MGLSVYDGSCEMTISKIFKRESKYTNTGIKVPGTKDMNGNWINFNGYARFIGEAHEKAKDLTEQTKIKTSNFKMDMSVKDGEPIANLTIFKFDFAEPLNLPGNDGFMNIADGLDDEMPFI